MAILVAVKFRREEMAKELIRLLGGYVRQIFDLLLIL